jgi:dTDP-4-amino-4,6-dideoxygalactose transaminase
VTVVNNQTRTNHGIVFGQPQITEAEIDEVTACLRECWLGTGPRTAQFAREFHGFKNGWGTPVPVNSCTAALHLSLLAADLPPKSEVIVPALTFCATVNAVIHAGLTPVLADVDPETMNLSPDEVATRITSRTTAIIPVHFAGRPCEMDELRAVCEPRGLVMIEDCAHAIEARYCGDPVGTLGDFGCFSFYATKNVSCGEGGMILARNAAAAARCSRLSLHGMDADAWRRFSSTGYKHYDVVECGFKYNMMDLQAAIGMHQLRRVGQMWQRRQSIWRYYDQSLRDLPVRLPAPNKASHTHSYHLYTLQISRDTCKYERDEVMCALRDRGIGTGVHYRSIPAHTYYATTFGWNPTDYPVATKIGNETLSIPLSPAMAAEDAAAVVNALTEMLTE